jgi:hypothetical protein
MVGQVRAVVDGRRSAVGGPPHRRPDKPDFTSIRIDVDMRTSAWMPMPGLRKMPAMRYADG